VLLGAVGVVLRLSPDSLLPSAVAIAENAVVQLAITLEVAPPANDEYRQFLMNDGSRIEQTLEFIRGPSSPSG